jgi:serine/threonine protein kinase
MIDLKQHEESVFETARKLADPAARRQYLDEACADNLELKGRVAALLEVESDADAFFREADTARIAAAAGIVGAASRAHQTGSAGRAGAIPVTEGPGTRIGRYKLLQRIGEGGCGVVYMAEQEEPVRRRVALKIIKLGMDTRTVVARFEAERQALALMDHPNIARVLDGGATEAGRPYFVMELVRGVRITEYCDQNRLDTRQRLDLFIQICRAIQHAHQKGVIHRDIKPSNVLLTLHDGQPVPKVIDFGIAKATEARLTDKTLFTAYEHFIGTPAYMSPEQAEMSGLDVDTRSDIYSLGVLLYELLTGRTPFDGTKLLQSGFDEMRRTLREKEPQRPSTMVTTLLGADLTMTAQRRHAEPPRLISELRGDLDWIVMKALEKDRRRRYETANGLAMDIERYLNFEPVSARPPSRLYRFKKLVRRNQGVFTAAGLVAAALVAGLGASTWLFLMERKARQRAVAAELQQARLRQEAERARANEAELRRKAEVREKITQAAFLISQERFNEADGLLQSISVLQPTLEGAAVFRSLGEWHALHDRWKQAAERFSTLLQIDSLDGWDVFTLDYLECGPALIELGDLKGYEKFRRAAVQRFLATPYPASDRILKVSLLLPTNEAFVTSLEPLARITEKSFSDADLGGDEFQAAWRAVSMALLEYRRGNWAEAARWSGRCLAYREYNAPRTATARVILAMALYREGRAQEARAELAAARELIDAKFNVGLDRGSGVQGFWFDWVFARILMREAEALVGAPTMGEAPAPASEGSGPAR